MHHFGSSLNRRTHNHCCTLDRTLEPRDDGSIRFLPAVAPTPQATSRDGLPGQATGTAPRSPPAVPTPGREIDWAGTSGQIGSAASAMVGRTDFAQVHDSHALVAHYYLATLLRALQRAGDRKYTGQLPGETAVRIVIGSRGDLAALRLVNSSGSDDRDRAAEQIVRKTAPFPPFQAELEKHPSRLKLIVNMRFQGGKNLVPEYGWAGIAGVADSDWLSPGSE